MVAKGSDGAIDGTSVESCYSGNNSLRKRRKYSDKEHAIDVRKLSCQSTSRHRILLESFTCNLIGF